MTTTEIIKEDLRLSFRAPWDVTSHELFLRSKKLPEAKIEFDRATDSYSVLAPARFAHLIGIQAKAVQSDYLPASEFLFDYQKWVVEKALQAKRFAVWADCGLGKTPMELEWARQVSHRTNGGRVVILCPNNIVNQTVEECKKFFGDTMPLLELKTRSNLAAWAKGDYLPEFKYAIANHHKFIDSPIDEMRWLAGVVLDESSILKGGGGVIKWNLIKSCRGIEFKWSGTATPAPNDTMEYASQASWLEKLRNEGEILWTYFVRDQKTQEWKVRPHAKKAFYQFMSAWSIYIRKPSAYGFQNQFDVPEPEIIETKIAMTEEQGAAMKGLMRETQHQELLPKERLGIRERSKFSQIAKGFIYTDGKKARRINSLKPQAVAEVIRKGLEEGRQILVWTVFDEESEIILEHCAGLNVTGLHGKDKELDRDLKLEAFRTGKIRCLVSKAGLLGYGMNFQFCSLMVFSGFDDSFEKFYQAIRRAHRYGAKERLKVHVPYVAELEAHMWNNLLRKKSQWEVDISQQELNYVEALRGLKG